MGCCQKGCPHTYHYACAVDTGERGRGNMGQGDPWHPLTQLTIGLVTLQCLNPSKGRVGSQVSACQDGHALCTGSAS